MIQYYTTDNYLYPQRKTMSPESTNLKYNNDIFDSRKTYNQPNIEKKDGDLLLF